MLIEDRNYFQKYNSEFSMVSLCITMILPYPCGEQAKEFKLTARFTSDNPTPMKGLQENSFSTQILAFLLHSFSIRWL